jgi:hypothetical protein
MLPRDDRWFLAYDPELNPEDRPTAPWVIATRGDGGFFDQEGYEVSPVGWAAPPEPQPKPTGWRLPSGHLSIAKAWEKDGPWRGYLVSFVRPDGTFDCPPSAPMAQI